MTQSVWALQGEIWFEGSPVNDATVFVLDERLQSQSVQTDQNGHFDFSNIIDKERPYRLFVYPNYLSSALYTYYGPTDEYCDSTILYRGDTISLDLKQGTNIFGHIDIEEDNILNGIVYAVPEEEELQARASLIEEDGSFSIWGLPSDSKGWTLEIESDNYPTQYLDGDYDEGVFFPSFQEELGTFSILPGIDVQGYVQDEEGHGISESNVHVYSGGEVKTTQSENDGWFSVEGLPPGEVLSWANRTDYATTYFPDSPYPDQSLPCLEEECLVDNAILVLPLESTLTLHFSDEYGDPIPWGSVLLYNELHTVGRGNSIENGTTTIDSLHNGKYHLMIFAAASGFYQGWYGEIPTNTNGEIDNLLNEPKWIDIEGNTDLTIQLHNSARLELFYFDEERKPIYGNEVLLYENKADGKQLLSRGKTDTFGKIIFSGLQKGSYIVDSIHQAYCISDLSYTSSFGFSQSPFESESIFLKEKEIYRNDIVLFVDSDHDKMSDQWEQSVGLQVGVDDANEDPDEDGISNLEEFYEQSNPLDNGCGCSNRSNLILLLPLSLFIQRRREVL